MSLKKFHLLMAVVASLALVGESNAVQINGGVPFTTFGLPSSSAGSFTLTGPVEVNAGGGTGDLSSLNNFSTITVNPVTISGIGASPTPEAFSPYLVFNGGNGGFQFNLATIAETGFTPGFETFHGVGTLVDTVISDGFDPTPATFTLAFNTAGGIQNFNVTLNTVPEPATYGLVAVAGLLLVPLGSRLRRKKA
jgi:hypothetical protein